MYDFKFKRANSIEQARALLNEEGAQILCGGQTLIPTLRQRLVKPEILVSISKIPELKRVKFNKLGEICIGSAVTHHQVSLQATKYLALAEMASRIGDPAVRYRGTIGGSLANNDPSACYPAAVLASNAVIATDERSIRADDFFLGMFETKLNQNEIILEVRFPIAEIANYQKFVQPASRFALVGVFVAKFQNHVRVAITGASENGVFRWSEAESNLELDFSIHSLKGIHLSSKDMINDIHGSSDYRGHLVSVMTKRAVNSCLMAIN